MSTSELKKLPAWLQLNPESATVTLTRPYDINDVKVDKLTMRSPTVREVRAADRASGDDEEQRELMLFAGLCDAGQQDLEGLKLVDYHRLQAGYFRLVQDDGV